MRVIAGTARGHNLRIAGTARPYLEKVRGAIFNSLCSWVPEANVLDLYAGSGSVGIEALSRGADRCTFVECDPASVAAIKENSGACKLSEQSVIFAGRVENYLRGCRESFDLIFLDPPFPEAARWDQLPELQEVMAQTSRILSEDGILIFRFEHETIAPPVWDMLKLKKDRRYGRSRVLFYCKAAQDNASADDNSE